MCAQSSVDSYSGSTTIGVVAGAAPASADIPFMIRSLSRLALFFALVAGGCGQGAVTDPLREAFQVDPRPVLGTWTRTLDRPAETFDVLVERDAGTLSGFFEYALWGRWWVVHFSDATWDGDAISFVEKTDFGQQPADSLVQWTASYWPGRDGPGASPPHLTLTASFGTPLRCCVVVMHYYRPGQGPVLPSGPLVSAP